MRSTQLFFPFNFSVMKTPNLIASPTSSNSIMAINPAKAATATLSLIEKLLLPELIESILLEVVIDVTPPNSGPDGKINRLRKQSLIGVSLASRFLAHRLVCRTLHRYSWRALAKVMGETIFDMRSKRSMRNLQTASVCKELAPWLQKLTVTLLHPASCGRNESDPAWHLYIALRRPINATGFQDVTPSEEEVMSGLIELIAACLNRLTNLKHVVYFNDYRNTTDGLEGPRRITVKIKDGQYIYHYGVQAGLSLLLRAVLNALVMPEHREIKMQIFAAHCFPQIAFSTEKTETFPSVQRLTLSDQWSPPRHDLTPVISIDITLTRTMFPALRTLVIDGGTSYSRGVIPDIRDVPNLTATILRGESSHTLPMLPAFLSLLRETLNSVSLQKMGALDYFPIFNALQGAALDSLELDHRYDAFVPNFWGATNLLEDLVHSIAKSIKIGPTNFASDLEAYWRDGVGGSIRRTPLETDKDIEFVRHEHPDYQ